jgi:RHS repeat-associated protein
VPSLTKTYSYAGIKYANPHAPTQIADGVSTTTFVYDNNGNVTQKTTDGTTTTYVWDYANRLTALGVLGATTTYGYDAFGTRVLQTGTSTTTIYPFKWYSVASSTGSGAKFATTTDYVFNGDSLVATIDQQTASGNATGTAKTRYIHPDHLGSTNVVTDESGALVQTVDFYPYGATRISVATSTNERRQYIGQFTDDSTLSYLQARYYDSSRGQFLSEDPSFLAIGDPTKLKQLTGRDQQAFLSDPQQVNSTSYSRDNPIVNKDPSGNAFGIDDALGFVGGGTVATAAYLVGSVVTQQPVTWGGTAGSFVTGGIIGWGAVNTPETLGVSNAISASITTGLIGGFYGNLTKQGVDLATGRQKNGLDYNDLEISTLTTAGTNGMLQKFVPDARIAGLTAGRGNMYATNRGLLTKAANSTISNISLSTGVKSAVSSQAVDLYRTVVGLLTQIVTTISQAPTQYKKN